MEIPQDVLDRDRRRPPRRAREAPRERPEPQVVSLLYCGICGCNWPDIDAAMGDDAAPGFSLGDLSLCEAACKPCADRYGKFDDERGELAIKPQFIRLVKGRMSRTKRIMEAAERDIARRRGHRPARRRT
jgi:hypothetical protein